LNLLSSLSLVPGGIAFGLSYDNFASMPTVVENTCFANVHVRLQSFRAFLLVEDVFASFVPVTKACFRHELFIGIRLLSENWRLNGSPWVVGRVWEEQRQRITRGREKSGGRKAR
jgi:hypothetical protein